jgi:DNA-directed RNA polymerase subunit RPC12/RpoP
VEQEEQYTPVNSRKRGKKPQKVESSKRARQVEEEEEVGPSTSSKNRRRKGFPERSPDLPNSSVGTVEKVVGGKQGATVVVQQQQTQQQEKNFNCTHCGLKFSSYERLTSHLLQCKSKKNPYDSYEYKCIKCKASFDIYLQYKKHIETHTGVVKYS